MDFSTQRSQILEGIDRSRHIDQAGCCETCGFMDEELVAWCHSTEGRVLVQCHECHVQNDDTRTEGTKAVYIPEIPPQAFSHYLRSIAFVSFASLSGSLGDHDFKLGTLPPAFSSQAAWDADLKWNTLSEGLADITVLPRVIRALQQAKEAFNFISERLELTTGRFGSTHPASLMSKVGNDEFKMNFRTMQTGIPLGKSARGGNPAAPSNLLLNAMHRETPMFNILKGKAEQPHLAETEKSIMHLGADTKGRPICLDAEMLCQHMLLTGSTGSGKTEYLIGLMTHAFAWNSGGVFIDGKGDITLYAKMLMIADHYGRRDDFYVLNFMTGSFRSEADVGQRTHRFNPFSIGSADTLTQMVVSLMEDVGGDASMWKGRATAMFTGVMRALTWLRDRKMIDLNVDVIRDNLNLKRIINLVDIANYPEMPLAIRRSVTSYLNSLPGYNEDKGHKQTQTTIDQHGYLEMQFTRILSSLADVYGHIFCADGTDIDLEDIVKNKRILLVMLPALEKSSDEIAMLGRIIVASLKIIAGALLSKTFDDDAEITQRLPYPVHPNDMPFLYIMDECSHYMVDGMDLLAAQARSLRISLVFSCQDIEAVNHRNPNVARSILTNTRTKIAMRSDGGTEDLEQMFIDAVPGRDDVMTYVKAKSSNGRSAFSSPKTLLKGFDPGEFILINSGKIVVGNGLYVDIKPGEDISIPWYVSIEKTADELLRLGDFSLGESSEPLEGGVPEAIIEFCKLASGSEALDGVGLASQALRTLSSFRETRKQIKIIELGA